MLLKKQLWMALGGFDKKVVASAKLAFVEKYGFAYSSDIALIQDNLSAEINVEDIGEGMVCINHRGCKYNIEIRDYIPPANKPSVEVKENTGNVPSDPERTNKWVSVWDAANH
jgi:hypothetical protein